MEAKTVSRTQIIMSTYINITLEQEQRRLIEDGFNIFKDIEKSISSFDENSKIYILNNNLHVELDNYTYEALVLSKRFYKDTDGYFDVTIGSITKDLYRFGLEQRVPTKTQLLKANINLSKLYIDKKRANITKGMKIDLGGMGKGYAVDKVAEYLKRNNVKKGIISASGDIRCLSTCTMNVQNPFVLKEALVSFKTLKDDLGISTSGNYNRYVDSKENNHLINPKIKKSQTKFVSITLIGKIGSADLDAYTTAASVMPKEKAYEFLDSLDVAYIVLQSDKKLFISKNINKFTKELVLNYAIKK